MSNQFLIEFTNYIINYPIKWYNFIKRIINRAIFYQHTIIFSKTFLAKNINVYKDVIDILVNNDQILKIIKEKDVIIIHLKNKDYLQIFKEWLRFIVIRACMELFTNVKYEQVFSENFFLLVGNVKIGFGDNKDCDIIISLKNTKNKKYIVYSYNYYYLCQDLKNNKLLEKYLKH